MKILLPGMNSEEAGFGLNVSIWCTVNFVIVFSAVVADTLRILVVVRTYGARARCNFLSVKWFVFKW